MPYGGTAPELDPPDDDVPEDPPDDDVPDDPPEDEVPDDPPDVPDEPPDEEPPEEDVDDEELDVSSLPPHAASAVALANKIAARVATRPVGGAIGVKAGSFASQNGHAASVART